MAINIKDRLAKASAKPSTKGKPERPVHAGVEVEADKVMKMKKELADLKLEYSELEGTLLEKVYETYDSARNAGRYASSIMVPGQTTNGLMAIWKDQFSNLPCDVENELRKKDPKYDDHFFEARTITVKKDVPKSISDEIIEKLMNYLGDDFEKLFDVKVEIGCKEGLAKVWNTVPDSVKGMVRQHKASVRDVTSDAKVV